MPFLQTVEAIIEEEGFPFTVPAVRALQRPLKFNKGVTFFVGENGSGKSTILEGIADKWGFSKESGNRSKKFASRDYDTRLAPALRLLRGSARPFDGFFLRAESFYNFATEMDDLEKEPYCGNGYLNYGGKSLHSQSHGEAFLSLFLNRFDGQSLLLLDEPEAALSPARQMTFLVRLHQLVEDHAQCIIATHSPIILAYPGATIYEFDEEGITEVSYKETQHYDLTRRFLENPEYMLHHLLQEDTDGE